MGVLCRLHLYTWLGLYNQIDINYRHQRRNQAGERIMDKEIIISLRIIIIALGIIIGLLFK